MAISATIAGRSGPRPVPLVATTEELVLHRRSRALPSCLRLVVCVPVEDRRGSRPTNGLGTVPWLPGGREKWLPLPLSALPVARRVQSRGEAQTRPTEEGHEVLAVARPFPDRPTPRPQGAVAPPSMQVGYVPGLPSGCGPEPERGTRRLSPLLSVVLIRVCGSPGD